MDDDTPIFRIRTRAGLVDGEGTEVWFKGEQIHNVLAVSHTIKVGPIDNVTETEVTIKMAGVQVILELLSKDDA
jgi:hypothetical protein